MLPNMEVIDDKVVQPIIKFYVVWRMHFLAVFSLHRHPQKDSPDKCTKIIIINYSKPSLKLMSWKSVQPFYEHGKED